MWKNESKTLHDVEQLFLSKNTRFPEALGLDNWGHGGSRLVSVIHNLIGDSATPSALVTPRGTGRCDPL